MKMREKVVNFKKDSMYGSSSLKGILCNIYKYTYIYYTILVHIIYIYIY